MLGPEPKSLWADKFRLPTIDELRLAQPKPVQSVLDQARKSFRGLDGITETLSWQGIPWRWTLVYKGEGELHENGTGVPGGRGFAYIIPDPMRLQICVPLTSAQIEALPMKRFKKPIRDGVAHARSVAGIWWPTWDVLSAAAMDEVLELTERKYKLLAGAAQPVGA
jgi:hypothetical protein